MLGPPGTQIVGRSNLAAAIKIAGLILSQLDKVTIASKLCASTISSMESAIVSLWGKIYRIPSFPFAHPSQGAIVLNSSGIPPFSIIPCLTASANTFKCLCPGFISFQVFTTPINGFLRISFSSIPIPLIMPVVT